MVAALAAPVLYLVVGQHRTQGLTPIHVADAAESEAVIHHHVAALLLGHGSELLGTQLQHFGLRRLYSGGSTGLQELHQFGHRSRVIFPLIVPVVKYLPDDPLRPLKVVGVGGIHTSVPVEAQPQNLHLFPVALGIDRGTLGGMYSGIDGVLLGRQAEGIEAHGMQYVVARLPLLPRYDIRADVAQGVPHVQPRS